MNGPSKTLLKLSVLALSVFPSVVLASAVAVDRQCQEVRQDSFDLGWRITDGSKKFSGQCVNAKSVRPAVILKKNSDQVQFANFYHNQKYWTATWDRDNVPQVSFLMIHFAGGGKLLRPAHTELLFRFPRAIELKSQTSNAVTKVKDAVLSWEAVFVNGGKYDFLTGLRNNFPIAGRITSLAARVPENLVPGEGYRKTERYALTMNQEEARYLFLQAIIQSDAWGYQNFYNTLSPNCTTQPFDILDSILERTRPQLQIKRFFTEWSPDPIAGPSRAALIQRGLITSDQKSFDLNQELGLN